MTTRKAIKQGDCVKLRSGKSLGYVSEVSGKSARIKWIESDRAAPKTNQDKGRLTKVKDKRCSKAFTDNVNRRMAEMSRAFKSMRIKRAR